MTYEARLMQAASERLGPYVPADQIDEVVRATLAAILEVQAADLTAWRKRIDGRPVVGSDDRRVRAAEKLGLGLVRLKLIEAGDAIRNTV